MEDRETPLSIEEYLGLDRYHAPQGLGARSSRRFHVMAKAAGSACNLDCTYCFYLSKRPLPGGPGAGHMDDELLEQFVRDYIQNATADEVVFSWQGGEPTPLATAGDANVTQKLLVGYAVGSTKYRVHLDGYNLLPYLTGIESKSPRKEFVYFSDDCDLLGLRYENWKFVFAEQRTAGTLAVWGDPLTHLRGRKMFDLRADPYERADVTSPPRQKPASFGIDEALETLQRTAVGQ